MASDEHDRMNVGLLWVYREPGFHGAIGTTTLMAGFDRAASPSEDQRGGGGRRRFRR
jgi:hypothetical protein